MSGGPVWVLPDEPAPVRLMNTIWADRHGIYDSLTSTLAARSFVAEALELAGPFRWTEYDRDALIALRDATRRLAAVVTEDDRPAASAPVDLAAAIDAVNAAAEAGPAVPRLCWDGAALRRAEHSDSTAAARARARLATATIELLTGPDPTPLRACHAPGCVLYFVKDHPRREWCSPACGNRARAARHYTRHRTPRP